MELVSGRLDLLVEAQFVELHAESLILKLLISHYFLQQANIVLEFADYLLLLVASALRLLGYHHLWSKWHATFAGRPVPDSVTDAH